MSERSFVVGCILMAAAVLLAFGVWGQQSIEFDVPEPSHVTITVTPFGDAEGAGEGAGEPPGESELLWTGDPPRAEIRNPQHTSITPDGKVGPGMLGDWVDEDDPGAQTNPVVVMNRGGATEDPSTVGTSLGFWWQVSPEVEHVIVQCRSWDQRGRYWVRVENPPSSWTWFEMPFADWTKEGDILSFDHVVWDRDQNGPGVIRVDEVTLLPDDSTAGPGPGPDPDDTTASRRVYRISDDWTVVASRAPLDRAHVAYSPISLGAEDGTRGWRAGHVYLVEGYAGARPGVSAAIKPSPYYLPDGPKRAYLGFELNGAVLDLGDAAPGKLRGPEERAVTFAARSPAANAWSGERVYVCDFSEVREPGVYRFEVEGVGQSREFRIAADAYDVAAGHALRAFAYQTEGMKLSFPRVKNPVAGVISGNVLPPVWHYDRRWRDGYRVYDAAAWAIAHHDGPYLLEAEDARLLADAADMDCHVKHVDVVLSLLHAYLGDRGKHRKGQLGVPNDTAYPDIVWLALLELRTWAHLQDAYGTGGVPSTVQFNRQREFGPYAENPSDPLVAVANPPDRIGSMAWGWCFARMAEATGNDAWLERAKRAYAWAQVNGIEPKTIHHLADRGRSDEAYTWELTSEAAAAMNAAATPWEIGLRAALYRATGDEAYREGLEALAATLPALRTARPFKDATVWVYWALAQLEGFEDVRSDFLLRADRYLAWQSAGSNPYRQSLAPDSRVYAYGAAQTWLPSRELLLAYELTGSERYRAGALENLNHALGANAFGRSWVSYVGADWWWHYQDFRPYVPGTALYGVASPTYGSRAPVRAIGLRSGPPRDKSFAPHEGALTASNEYTVHETQSPAAFCLAHRGVFGGTAALGPTLHGVRPLDADAVGRLELYLP